MGKNVSSEYVNGAAFTAGMAMAVKERGLLTDMRVENPSLVVWNDGAPVLWRAGAAACELVTDDTVFPEGVIEVCPVTRFDRRCLV